MSAFDKAIQQAIETYNRLRSIGESDAAATAAADEIIAGYYAERAARKAATYRFGPLPGPVQDVDGFFEEGARIVERNLAGRQAEKVTA